MFVCCRWQPTWLRSPMEDGQLEAVRQDIDSVKQKVLRTEQKILRTEQDLAAAKEAGNEERERSYFSCCSVSTSSPVVCKRRRTSSYVGKHQVSIGLSLYVLTKLCGHHDIVPLHSVMRKTHCALWWSVHKMQVHCCVQTSFIFGIVWLHVRALSWFAQLWGF